MFEQVVDFLLHAYSITPGCAIRLSRCNREIRHIVMHHQFFWKYIALKMGHLRFRSNDFTLRCVKSRCRECGITSGRNTLTRYAQRIDKVIICNECASHINAYNELVDRQQIFAKEGTCWSTKRRVLLSGLHFARRTINKKLLYWGFEWRKTLRGMEYTVKRNI